jgi:hypothetical protein
MALQNKGRAAEICQEVAYYSVIHCRRYSRVNCAAKGLLASERCGWNMAYGILALKTMEQRRAAYKGRVAKICQEITTIACPNSL